MPHYVNFSGRMDLRFLKRLTMTYCPLLTGGRGTINQEWGYSNRVVDLLKHISK